MEGSGVVPQATLARGLLVLARVLAVTGAGVVLATRAEPAAWAAGQALLALAFVQWFVLLHECGHGTLTGARAIDRAAGRLAGFLALIPFEPWRRVHARHHRWTGWQDKDPTTEGLTPRRRPAAFLLFVDVAWWTGVPLVAVLYRVQNYWNLPRLGRQFPHRRGALAASVAALIAAWSALAWVLGPLALLRLVGPALLLALVVEDEIILSQHTHVPQLVSHGARVRPIRAAEQEAYTRSLAVPRWVSRWLLLGIEAHELHHAHPLVPGYRLLEVARPTTNAVPWWRFVLRSRLMRGSRFLYENRAATGVAL